MSRLKLSRRDDPLAIGQGEPEPSVSARAAREETASPPPAVLEPSEPEGPEAMEGADGESNNGGSAEERPGRESAKQPVARATVRGPYDEDRLVQTGWRLYESLVDEVAVLSDQLTAEGYAASRASLVTAVLHRYLPRDLEEANSLLRELRQASAGRARG